MSEHEQRLAAAARVMHGRLSSAGAPHWDDLTTAQRGACIKTMSLALNTYGVGDIRGAANELHQHMDAVFEGHVFDDDEMTIKEWRARFGELSRELLRVVPR